MFSVFARTVDRVFHRWNNSDVAEEDSTDRGLLVTDLSSQESTAHNHEDRQLPWISEQKPSAVSWSDTTILSPAEILEQRINLSSLPSEHLYQLLFAHNPHPLWLVDVRTRAFLDINQAAVDRYGYTKKEFLAMKIDDLYFPEDLPALHHNLSRAKPGNNFSASVRHRAKDGNLMHIEIVATRFEHHGRLLSLAQAVDVSKREQAQEELRASEERYRMLFERNLAAMFHSRGGKLVDCNEAMCRMFGYSRKEMRELDLRELYKDRELGLETEKALIEGAALQNDQLEMRRRDGSVFTVLANLNMVQGVAQVPVMVGVMLDVTETKKLQEQLLQSQKMESIGRLTGGIAHDFNNILMIINCYCELLMEKISGDGSFRRPVEQIREAGVRAASLTGQLLAFSRKQVLAPVTMDLNRRLSDLKEILKRLLGEDVELRMSLTKEPWLTKVDPNQIEQVVFNLVINARDAMSNGGSITIETRNAHLGEDFVANHPGSKIGDFVAMLVRDTGSGISKEIQTRIFEPFFTTKESGKGTGLGLSTVYGIVKQSEGFLTVDSDLGCGATFTVYLPRAAETCPILEDTPIEIGDTERRTILVVEDEDATREAIVSYLEENGFEVVTASNGKSALQLCDGSKLIDVLLTDIVMPGMSGPELAEAIKSRYPLIRTVYMSGYTDDVLVRCGMGNSQSTILSKPFALPQLISKLKNVLGAS